MLSGPTASTQVAGVIGDPVRHSLSPVLHNAAFAALGLDWVYAAFHVRAGDGEAAVDAMRTLGLAGLSVTMPHKTDAAAAVDRLGPAATRLGVVNTISWVGAAARGTGETSAELEGESTDGAGFMDALKGDDGFDPDGRSCVVLGAGGAARAISLALGAAGAASVLVVARSLAAAESCSELAGPAGSALAVAGGGVPPDVADPSGFGDRVAAADLVINATPVGMRSADGLPFGLDPTWIRPGQFVADLVYTPAGTPLLAAARAAGATGANGLGMLIHQAARQIEIWTGRPAPIEAMSVAAVSALGHRQAEI